MPDLCVIGGGTAGHAVALAAGALGARCTLVDPRASLGAGQAADLAEAMLTEAAHVHPAGGIPFDLDAFRTRLGRAVADAAPNHAARRLRTLGVTVVRGTAAFADARTVVAAGEPIRARRFVLAPGAVPTLPAWAAGLPAATLLRPATLPLMTTLPAHVAVVAETPDGLAWAQALCRLGCGVTLLAIPRAAAPFDPELVALVLAALARDGVDVRVDAIVGSAEPAGDGLRLHTVTHGAVEASHVLIARAPAPAIAGLGLDRAGIPCPAGAPVVDRSLRTPNRRVFALGDVLGDPRPGGAAIPHQVGLVLRAALFRQPVRYRAERVPVVLATRPELAQVGVLEDGADTAPCRVLRWPLSEPMRGGVKVVTTRGGRVLGAAVAGPGAADAIVPWSLAIDRGIAAGALANLPVPASALAEASRRAALSVVTARLAGPWVRRLLRLLRALP